MSGADSRRPLLRAKAWRSDDEGPMTMRRSYILAGAIIMAEIATRASGAAACPPEALGTFRLMAVGTEGGLEVGLKSYPRTLPLQDREVVLTFDDGPAPETTAKILDALAKECVLATFFDIGKKVD
jgi:peptidoglycan-N-acetylglucosamine deacetylase